jgi:ethanolamine ammonia-lyase small subunit
MNSTLKPLYDLSALKAFTPARIGLPRAGSSISTREMLQFDLDHARARDAVHLPFDSATILNDLETRGFEALDVHSNALTRSEFLQRPDLGRQLNASSAERLKAFFSKNKKSYDLAFVVADGLSTRAIHENAVSLLDAFKQISAGRKWTWAPVVVASQARVALADEIGEILNAQLSIILIGERPGLSSAESMGIYVTYAPQKGRTDAQRNCISNIRKAGLTCDKAARQLEFLISGAFQIRESGVNLKLSENDHAGKLSV